ncbi:hypothetical protein ACBY01_16620 [Sphingomonas sp. ac-8]|uniref:hypothetical protein n=1 Tax=Sphingomonas sp. ac-8 TaxID=3242977 RepID=UPI003A805CA3
MSGPTDDPLAAPPDHGHCSGMLNFLSLLIGLFALLLAIPALIPIVSLANWIVFPVALLGFIVGLLSSRNAGRNLNLMLMIVSGLRLFLTGGLF